MQQSTDTTITQKGQVTIPQEMRRALGIEARGRVRVELDAERGVVTVRPIESSLLDGYGAATPHSRPEDFERLREEFEEGVAEEADHRDRAG